MTNMQMEQTKIDDPLSLGKIIALHLLPGFVIVTVAAAIMWLLRDTSIPPIASLSLAIPLALIPTELGTLLYLGKKRNGRLSLDGIVHYGRPMPTLKWIGLTIAMFVATILLLIVGSQLDGVINTQLFGWWPTWMDLNAFDADALSTAGLWGSISVVYLFANFLGPYVEELYFRGYLLPRMDRFGRWAIPLNSFLFALYHFWTPWMVIGRTFGTMTFGYSAKKFNLNMAIAIHILINTIGTTIDVVGLFV